MIKNSCTQNIDWDNARIRRDKLIEELFQAILDAKLPCGFVEDIPQVLARSINEVLERIQKEAVFTE